MFCLNLLLILRKKPRLWLNSWQSLETFAKIISATSISENKINFEQQPPPPPLQCSTMTLYGWLPPFPLDADFWSCFSLWCGSGSGSSFPLWCGSGSRSNFPKWRGSRSAIQAVWQPCSVPLATKLHTKRGQEENTVKKKENRWPFLQCRVLPSFCYKSPVLFHCSWYLGTRPRCPLSSAM